MKKIIYTLALLVFISCGGGEKKTDTKKESTDMGPVHEDTTEAVLSEAPDEFAISAADTTGFSESFGKFKKLLLKRDMKTLKEMIFLPMDISCLISFNPKLADQLEDMMVTEENWEKYYNDLFSAKVVKLISHSDANHFIFTRVSDGSVICSLTIAEKKSSEEEGGGEGMLGYSFSFTSPDAFQFQSIGCAGGGVTDRDIISR
ncbi:MAG: hypothetical protein ACOZCO_17845 [Bacteroidota bacterium]